MANKMLIDSSHPEETRVVVVRGNRIEEFDFESQDKKQLKGNIYLARVTRVEPSLQAAFVDYGGNRHGFLAFNEIHPDYYQIPYADRQALLQADAQAEADENEAEDGERSSSSKRRRAVARDRKPGRGRGRKGAASTPAEAAGETEETAAEDVVDLEPMEELVAEDESAATEEPVAEGEDSGGNDDESTSGSIAMAVDADVVSEPAPGGDGDENGNGGVVEVAGGAEDQEIESVGAEDALEELPDRRRPMRRQYKIQEVIKRRQILLVQVVKEERGNKGAAMTTYLSLAGRYSVLMPNTPRGGGISRKITNVQDRKRLKDVVTELDVPQGMGVILRTAGANRTKAEIKRDYEYLMRLWENVRSLTLQSTAPALVYEEGSLIKRSVRDLYNKDIDEILVAGDDGYREAKDFMRMLMPSHAKAVQPYRDIAPIFARAGIEAQLDRLLQPQVTLKSGGYIIINQTEALVSIDVNSGRSTREHSIEDTALQTNLEAAEEIARQLRLRDLAGLIVIDFIDMEEKRNNRSVEKRLKDHLKNDRARIQVGRISHFGLLEMSRQRIRASVLESTMQTCPHCGGSGHVRSDSSIALHVLRAVEDFLLKDNRYNVIVQTPTATALYILNHKRASLVDLERRFGLTLTIDADATLTGQNYTVSRGTPVEKPVTIEPARATPPPEVEEEEEIPVEDEAEATAETAETARTETAEDSRKRRRRRRRRGGRGRDDATGAAAAAADAVAVDAEDIGEDGEGDEEAGAAETSADAEAGETEAQRKRRRRGKRGGRRNRRDEEADGVVGAADDGAETSGEPEGEAAEAAAVAIEEAAPEPVETTEVEEAGEDVPVEAAAEDSEPPRRSRRRAVAEAPAEAETSGEPEGEAAEAAAVAIEEAAPEPVETTEVEEAGEDVPVEAAAEDSEPPRRSRRRAVAEAPAEPVVTSAKPEDSGDKPRKGGWWQRRGFF